MIRFNAFGTLELRGTAGQATQSVLAQPRRKALLSYLAVATPRGLHRRETLLALLWPELDDARGRAALSKAVHYLRASLGQDTVVSVGYEEVGLDWTRFECDVADFEAAVERGKLEDALDLYRGDLAPGFFVDDAPEFEQWLERERTRVREMAAHAARALSVREQVEGRNAAATTWAKRAVALNRYDEGDARRLMTLLELTGERAGALRVYDDLARTLREDLGAEPAAETRALHDAVRAREAPFAAPQQPLPQPPQLSQPPQLPVSARPSPKTMRLTAILLALIVVLAVARAVTNRNAVASTTESAVAVLPFAYRGAPAYAYLGEGIVDVLSARVAVSPELRTIDPQALLSWTKRDGRAIDLNRGRAAGRQFDSRYVLIGSIVEVNGQLQLTASLWETGGGRTPVAQATQKGSADELFALVDRLASELLPGAPANVASGSATPSAIGTSSIDALDAYLSGERNYRAGRFKEATGDFDRATRMDTLFARAWFRLSSSADWEGNNDRAYVAMSRAARLSSRLSAEDVALLDAWQHYLEGRIEEADRSYREYVERNPDNVDAWMQLAEIRYHWSGGLGYNRADAERALRRVLQLVPDHAAALLHTIRVEAANASAARFDSLAARLRKAHPEPSVALEVDVINAFRRRDIAGAQRSITQLSWPAQTRVIDLLAVLFPERAETEQLIGQAAGESGYPIVTAMLLAHLDASRGRPQAALARLDALRQDLPARIPELRAALLARPDFPATPDQLNRAIADVTAITGKLEGWGANSMSMIGSPGIFAPRRLYLLGALNLRTGDQGAVVKAIEQLNAYPASATTERAFAREYAQLLRARMELQRKQPANALTLLGPPRPEPLRILPDRMSYVEADERYTRAEAHRMLGEDEAALRWYETFPDLAGYDLPYLGLAMLRRAELYAKLGRAAEARARYEYFLELNSNAEPAQTPVVQQARAALSSLGR